MAQVTLTMDEYNELKTAKEQALEEVARLKANAFRAVLDSDATGTIKALNELARTQLQVIRFAMANLPPEDTRGWPMIALEGIAGKLELLPDRTDDDTSLSLELRAFAKEVRAADQAADLTRHDREARAVRRARVRELRKELMDLLGRNDFPAASSKAHEIREIEALGV